MAETTGYLLLGLAVVFGVSGLYAFSLQARLRSTVRLVTLMQRLADDSRHAD